ncbi:unnamed protein product [Spirodela intermedia]|uniref:Uncharacterized protein n=1 Tax=Spirodela intermedia TaxID=51605 RepID=A0A7I8KBA6_SPIIN|nr:unnamed protein product [Spirodela intermedia]
MNFSRVDGIINWGISIRHSRKYEMFLENVRNREINYRNLAAKGSKAVQRAKKELEDEISRLLPKFQRKYSEEDGKLSVKN